MHVDLTVAERAACALTDDLLAVLPAGVTAVVADKGYDTNAVRASIEKRAAQAVIPAKCNRKKPIPHDANLYADRNKVERFFGRIKQCRVVATRYEKTACSFLAIIHIAATLDWLR